MWENEWPSVLTRPDGEFRLMLLQTNSYVVPKDRRAEHARLLRRFRQTLARLGCDHFEAYEQVGQNWNTAETSGRFVQIMRFRDRRHQLAVQAAERQDPLAQQLIAEFCDLINFPYQQQHGLFAVGFYNSALPMAPARPGERGHEEPEPESVSPEEEIAAAAAVAAVDAASEVAPADQQTYVAPAAAAAEFSGEPVEPEAVAPQPEHVQVQREEHEVAGEADEVLAEDAAEILDAAPLPADEAEPVADEVPSAGDREATGFRDEMEALGAVLDHEPMSPAAELSEPHADLMGLDIELPDELETSEAHEPQDPHAHAHSSNGNGAVSGGNGSVEDHDAPSRLDQADADLARALDDSGPADDSFDSLLEASSNGQHQNGNAESHPAPGGSGIGSVLDSGLLDDDLDVALPAELIDDELTPHLPDARPRNEH